MSGDSNPPDRPADDSIHREPARRVSDHRYALWKSKPSVRLFQALALLHGYDPQSLPEQDVLMRMALPSSMPREFWNQLDIAESALRTGELPALTWDAVPGDSLVELHAVSRWAARRELGFVRHWATDQDGEDRRAEVVTHPWGKHSTELLSKLMAAAQLWRTVDEGGNYDPSDITTAPTNAQVEDWLERHGVESRKTREVMATILRADTLRVGPRGGSRGDNGSDD